IRKRAPELLRTLYIDVHHHVATGRKQTLYLRAQRSIQVPVHFSPLGKVALLHPLQKGSPCKEVIVPTVHLSFPPGSRRCRHGVTQVSSTLQKLTSYRGFPTARWSTENQREGQVHSTFSTCSLNRSSSSFSSTTSATIAASFALLPSVFASRSISWSRKPSRFPAWSTLASA